MTSQQTTAPGLAVAAPLPDVIPADPDMLVLQTMRSHDQWNTTIYSNDDRYRGVRNIREMVLMNRKDMRERGLEPHRRWPLVTALETFSQIWLRGFLPSRKRALRDGICVRGSPRIWAANVS